MMLSIFNNGSAAWVILILLAAWVAVWGYRFYKSHTGGYYYRNPDGTFSDVKRPKKEVLMNTDFYMLVLGVIGLTFFIFIVNADYRKYSKERAQTKWEKQKAKEAK